MYVYRMSSYTNTCVHVWNIYISICMYMYTHVLTYINIFMYVYIHAYIYTYIYLCVFMYLTCLYFYVCIYLHVFIYLTYIHILHIYIYTYVHVCRYIFIWTYYMCVYIHRCVYSIGSKKPYSGTFSKEIIGHVKTFRKFADWLKVQHQCREICWTCFTTTITSNTWLRLQITRKK